MLGEAIYPSYGPIAWTLDSKGLFYDAGKVTDIKSMDIELNRKTRLHMLGAAVASDADIFSDESNPELGIAPKEFPSAAIDESYPDYIFGSLSTVQNEMKVYYAPHFGDGAMVSVSWERPLRSVGQPRAEHGLQGAVRVRDHPHRRPEIQDRPHPRGPSRLEEGRDGRGLEAN